MTHFICTGGCGGVSDVPGVCQAEGCRLHAHPLKKCNCEDGKHAGLVKKCEKCDKLCDGNCDLEPFKPELTN